MKNAGTSRYSFPVDPSNPYTTYTQLIRLVGESKRVLDIGCGTGELARYLIERQCTVVGIERDPSSAERAAHVCEKVVCGNAEEDTVLDDTGESFDVVILGDVLEHLRDPEIFLRKLKAKLSPGGFLALSVPNVGHWSVRRELLRGRWDPKELGICDRTHLHFFTRRSLNRMVSEGGYSMTYFFAVPNYNCFEDITFRLLTPLYRHSLTRNCLNLADRFLSRIWPTLFGYQFVCKLELHQ